MGETLYRKYRPQTFATIQGQEGITKTLTNQIAHDKIAHAYLLSGTRGTGKTTTARVFTKAINCHNRAAGEFEPCGECSSCTEITLGRSVDVIELDAATHTGVDIVREQIIENARFLPTRDRYKIFIIDEVHMLSTSSFNALLKSLEEPPAHVVYILATTELHKIPATVASRCQRFIFRPLELGIMERKLQSIAVSEGVTVDPTVLRRILAVSGGAMRDAESLLGQLLSLGASHISDADADALLLPTLFTEAIGLLSALAAGQRDVALGIVESLFETGSDIPSFHESVIRRAHELLVVHAAKEIPAYLGIFSDTEAEQLRTVAPRMNSEWLAQCIKELLDKKTLYKTIASQLIPLHLVIIEVTRTPESAPVRPAVVAAAAAPAPRPVVVQSPPAQVVAAPAPVPIPAAPTPQPAPAAPVHIPSAASPGMDEEIPPPPEEHFGGDGAPEGLHGIVTKNWSVIVNDIVGQIPSLRIILSSVSVINASGEEVELAVKFPMYRDKLLDLKTKARIEEILTNRCGTPLRYKVTHIPEDTSAQDAAVADMLNDFGGRVVG